MRKIRDLHLSDSVVGVVSDALADLGIRSGVEIHLPIVVRKDDGRRYTIDVYDDETGIGLDIKRKDDNTMDQQQPKKGLAYGIGTAAVAALTAAAALVANADRLVNTNQLNAATNAVTETLRGEIAAKAPKAWGSLTSDGLVAPSNTLVIRAESTVFAGGHAFERVNVGTGTFGFLVSRGAAAYTGEPGTFRFRDAVSGEYFGYTKNSYVVPLRTDGIVTSTNSPLMVTLVYRVTMDGYPIINYKPTLENFSQTAWEPLNDAAGNPLPGATYAPAWEDPDPEPGTKVCHINVEGSTKGFFCASIAMDGNSVFETNMPADLKEGIVAPSADNADVRYVVEPFVEGGEVKWRIKQ